MGSTNSDAVRIAPGNVRVPHAEFRAVWDEAGRREDDDAYADAVAQTCRWLAAAPLRTALCGGTARSPVTLRASIAREELIAAEWTAAQHDDGFSPGLAARPGWCEGVRATLRWAWRHEGPPPLDARSA